MNFYAYKGTHDLGKEPLGSDNRMIWRGLKTPRSPKKTCRELWGDNFRLFSFTNFYDDTTFQRVL